MISAKTAHKATWVGKGVTRRLLRPLHSLSAGQQPSSHILACPHLPHPKLDLDQISANSIRASPGMSAPLSSTTSFSAPTPVCATESPSLFRPKGHFPQSSVATSMSLVLPPPSALSYKVLCDWQGAWLPTFHLCQVLLAIQLLFWYLRRGCSGIDHV